MARPEAFLAIEASLATRLQKQFYEYAAPILIQIETAIAALDWDEATRLASTFDLRQVLEDTRDHITWLTNLAMLFGASRVTRSPGTSVVGLGYEKMMTLQAVNAFCLNVTQGATTYLTTQAVQLVARKRQEADDGQGSYLRLKADKSKLVSYDPKQRVLLPFSSFVNEAGKAYFNMVSSLHTSRVSAYGFTTEAYALGMDKYQITEQLDKRICPVCRTMHGRVFEVKQARDLLDVVLRVSEKEDFKNLQPWPGQSKSDMEDLSKLTPDEIVSKGWHIPPFHPQCRGLLTRVGKVPSLQQVATNTIPDSHATATEADFDAIGWPLSPEKVKAWNKAVKIPPAELVSTLTGKPVDKYLQALLTADDPASASGISALSVSNGLVKMKLDTPMHGTTTNAQTSLKFDPTTETMALTKLIVNDSEKSADFTKKFMQSLYTAAQDMLLKKVAIEPAMGYGSYAWAKAGFIPDSVQWEAVKKGAYKALKTSNLYPASNPLLQKALEAIKTSIDPANIFALADLSVGEVALVNQVWNASLDINDPESVARFLSVFGN